MRGIRPRWPGAPAVFPQEPADEETEDYPVDTMPREAVWRENGQKEILVNQEGRKHIAVLTYPNGKPVTIDGIPLPSKFTVDIRIKGAGNKQRDHFQIPLEVN